METTGKSVPGVKTKILSSKNDEVTKTPMLEGGFSPDIGEIAGWGRNVFMGYLNKENETKEVMTEGKFFLWFLKDADILNFIGSRNVVSV